MRMVEIETFEAQLRPQIQAALLAQTGYLQPGSLREAVQHLLGSGKLFRPLLALAVTQCIKGSDPAESIGLVTPLELVHTFTLIHDDLPCMDDAELRRGLATVHRAYGEAMAVLAGDDLLSLAFAVLSAPPFEDAQRRLKLVQCLSTVTHQVVQGQVEDLAAEGANCSLEDLVHLHSHKTGALISAACTFGAVLAGAGEDVEAKLTLIGREIGLAFQIRDDLLSLQSDDISMGKTLSTDLDKEKSTFPRLLGVEGAQHYAAELVGQIEAQIDSLSLPQPQLLKAYASLALQRHS